MQEPSVLDHLRDVKARYEAQLLHKANVVGVGIGLLTCEDSPGGIPCIVVNVTHKVPLEALARKDRIPKEIEGIPVSVQAIGDVLIQ